MDTTNNNTLRQPSPSTGLAIGYITVGTLAAIWATVWWYFLRNEAAERVSAWQWYVCAGLFWSGVAVGVIGLLVGRIGLEAQNADVPLGQVTAAAVEPNGVAPAAATTQAAAPAASMAPMQPVVMVPAQTVKQ